MDENIKANTTVPSANMEQKQSPAFDPRDEHPDEYFDDYMYDDLYYDDICMSCQHGSAASAIASTRLATMNRSKIFKKES